MTDSTESLAKIRGMIVRGLCARRSEIERAIRDRINSSVPHLAGREDPNYESGLQEAVAAVVGYSLDAIEKGPEWSGSVPQAAAAQARRAARVGVSLGTIQRRYLVGHREFGEFVTQETESAGFLNNGEVIHHLRRTQEELLENLIAEVEIEYNDELDSIAGSRRSEIVHRLLSSEPVEPAELADLDYEIDTHWHLGLIASGASVEEIVDRLKERYGCKCLCVALNSRLCVWLGMQELPAFNGEYLSTTGDALRPVAVGEPGKGFDGWQLTHQQARAAFAVALRRPERVAWYADTRLLAAALQNETLVRSLTRRYLLPLSTQSDGGAKLRQTLRTYIDLECNATSTAHGLQVRRHTVTNRVCAAERLIGASLRECLAELDVALRLEELNGRETGSHPGES